MTRKDAGFTLIELMIAVAILAIILTIGLPSFHSAIQSVRVGTTLNLLSADMAMARSSAVMRRSQVVVCPRDRARQCRDTPDWSRGWMVFEDDDGNRQPDEDHQILRLTDAPAGDSALLYLPSSRRYLRYQRDGRSANANLTVYLCRERVLVGKVVVNNVGRVRTARETAAVPCPKA